MSFIKKMKPRPGGHFKQGYYELKNPKKYMGQERSVIYRSGLELKLHRKFDLDDSILAWESEPDLDIKYMNPITGKPSKYFVDYRTIISVGGKRMCCLVEAKASIMMKPPKPIKSNATLQQRKNYLMIKRNYVLNTLKKKAAESFCKRMGWRYMIVDEGFFKK